MFTSKTPPSICNPLGKEMEEKKRERKEREPGRERERKGSHRNVWSKPVTGKGHAFLWAGPTVTPSRQMQALSHSHTHTSITVSAHVYHIQPHMSKEITWWLTYAFTKQTPGSARCQTRMSVLECYTSSACVLPEQTWLYGLLKIARGRQNSEWPVLRRERALRESGWSLWADHQRADSSLPHERSRERLTDGWMGCRG